MSPETVRRIHYILALAWLASFPPVIVLGLQRSLPFLTFISIYAIVVGHWASGMAMRVESNLTEDT
jgi:hypothetical protein